MLNYGVYLVIPGTFQRTEYIGSSGLYTFEQNDAITYTLYRSGEGDKDFIYDLSLSTEANKSGSFQFSILPSHTYYSYLRRYIQYICVEDLDDNEVLFYGRIYSISMNFNGEKKVSAEGIMSNLLDCPVYNPNLDSTSLDTDIFKLGGTPASLFSMAIASYRALIRPDINLGTIFPEASTYTFEDVDVSGGQTVGDFIVSHLVDGAGGYVRTRYEKASGGNVRCFLDWLPDPSIASYSQTVNSQVIEFGVNLLDIEAEFGDDSIMTGIVPLWTDENDDKHWATRVVDNPLNPGNQMLQPYIIYGTGASGIGVQMIDLPELTDQSEALVAARQYAERYCNYNLSDVEFDSFRVRALDMHYFGESAMPKIRLYDRVNIVSSYHGLSGIYTCTAIEIDLENPSNNIYTFSVYRPKASSNDKTICRQLGIKESKKRKAHNE